MVSRGWSWPAQKIRAVGKVGRARVRTGADTCLVGRDRDEMWKVRSANSAIAIMKATDQGLRNNSSRSRWFDRRPVRGARHRGQFSWYGAGEICTPAEGVLPSSTPESRTN